MKSYRSILFVLLLSFALLSIAIKAEDEPVGKPPDWKFKLETDIYRWRVSPNDKYFFVITDGEDNPVMNCYTMADGKQLWSHNMVDLDKDLFTLCRWVSNDVVMIGEKNKYVFLKAQDGSIIKTLNLFCESWGDVSWKYNPQMEATGTTQEPYFVNNYAIFFGGDGFQVIDLVNQKIIYQSTQSVSRAMFKDDGIKVSMWPYSGMFSAKPDTIYTLNYHNGEFNVKPWSDKQPNSRLYVTDYSYKNDRLDFYENSVEYTNLATNKVEQTLSINPNEPDYFGPVIWNDGLGFVTSLNNVQTLYWSRTLAPVFKTSPADLPGFIDQFYGLDNGDVIMFVFNNDDSKMSIARIDSKTGRMNWKNTMFKYDGSYKTGHQKGGAGEMLLKMAGSLALSVVGTVATRGAIVFTPNPTGIINSLNKDKYSEGYAKVITWSNDRMTIAAGGKIYSELSNGTHDNYDGEGIFTFDLKTGKLINNFPCPIIAKSDADNAYNDLVTFPLFSGNIVMGMNDVYVIKNDNVERFTFGKSKVELFKTDSNSIVIAVVNKDDDYCDYWRIDLGSSKSTKTLLARSKLDPVYVEKIFVPLFSPILSDTKFGEFPCRLLIDENGISGFKLIDGDINLTGDSWANPLWKISFDDFKVGKIDVDGMANDLKSKLTNNQNYQPEGEVQGLSVNKDRIIVMGKDGLGYIKSDGTCKWVKEWEPDVSKANIGVNEFKGYILYSMGDYTKIYKSDCSGECMMSLENSYKNTNVRIPADNSGMLVIKHGEDIEFYKFK